MTRSKQLHIVKKRFSVNQPNDVNDPVLSVAMQVDDLLSQNLGRTIRNGNSFRLVGAACVIYPRTSGDYDTGMAVNARIRMVPTTQHTVSAWRGLFKQWMKQKRLANTAGGIVRYDDFEVGFDAAHLLSSPRQSNIYYDGINDSNTEDVVLMGASTGGSVISLEDYYNSLNPIAEPSKNPLTNVNIKQPKYFGKFPAYADLQELWVQGNFTSMVDVGSTPDSLGGAIAMSDYNWLPADNHLAHLTGTVQLDAWVLPPDTGFQIADEAEIEIHLIYEGWSPLVESKKMSRKTKGKK